MSTLKPYPAYKDSGVEWLGQLPTSWNKTKLKWDCRLRAGGTPESTNDSYWLAGDDPEGIPFVAIGDMSQRDRVMRTEKSLSSDGISQKNLPIGAPGTVLIAMYASVGEVSTLAIRATWNQALISIEPITDKLLDSFAAYFLRTAKDDLLKDVRSNTQANLNATQISNVWIPIPPVDTQQAIVDFLDRETAEIDAFVAESEKLITLLNERRAAVITEAVTKGLDPSAPMKDTGIEWLGEVPAHWYVGKVNLWCEVTLGKMLDESKFTSTDGILLPYVRAANVNDKALSLDNVNEMPFTSAELTKYSLQRGDLLVVEGGSVGQNVVLSDDMPGWGFQKTVNRVRPRTIGTSTIFLGFAIDMLRMKGVIDMLSAGSTIAHLTAEKLGGLVLAWPPGPEQIEISSYVEDECTKVEKAIETAREAIALAKERRQALISAAVTGKIDVRSAA